MSRPFHIVDVFSHRPFTGNPVAVILTADHDEAAMSQLAAWTGMPETVFVTRPTNGMADYAVRIFSPVRELAFAGHPSIGACHLLLELGHVVPRAGILIQECPAGFFDMHVEGDGGARRIGFSTSVDAVQSVAPDLSTSIGQALGRKPQAAFVVRAGARWVIARFETALDLAALAPSFEAVRRLAESEGALGISVYSPSPDDDADFEVRSFAPSIGVDEDAVCGGGNACVAAAIAREGGGHGAATVIVSQGRHLGRVGRVRLDISTSTDRVRVSGRAVTSVSGLIASPCCDPAG